jgi:hypothetical protein
MDDKKVPKISLTFATELEQMKIEDGIDTDLKVVTYEISLVKECIAKRNRADYTNYFMPYLQQLEAKQKYLLQLKAEHEKTNFITLPEKDAQAQHHFMGKGGEA